MYQTSFALIALKLIYITMEFITETKDFSDFSLVFDLIEKMHQPLESLYHISNLKCVNNSLLRVFQVCLKSGKY